MPTVPHLDGSIVAKRQLKDAVTLFPGARIFLGGVFTGSETLASGLGEYGCG